MCVCAQVRVCRAWRAAEKLQGVAVCRCHKKVQSAGEYQMDQVRIVRQRNRMTRVLRKRPRARVVVAGRKATLGVTMARNKKAAAPSRESAVAPLQQFDPIPLTAPASAAAVIASPQPSPGASPAIFRALRQRPNSG